MGKQASAPSWLTALQKNNRIDLAYKPVIIEMDQAKSADRLNELNSKNEIKSVIDNYQAMLEELYIARNPAASTQDQALQNSLDKFIQNLFSGKPLWQTGSWVYFPWSNTLVHTLPKELHSEVRTNRNRDLITTSEQDKLASLTIAIAGLSIGQNIAYVLALLGCGKKIHLADFDYVSLSNTNRINTRIDQIELHKGIVAARMLAAYNPYVEVELFAQGVNEENVSTFMEGVDIVVDEVDDYRSKLLLRKHAKSKKLPVLMAADVGEQVVMTIERYDQEPGLDYFGGVIDDEVMAEITGSKYNFQTLIKAFISSVGVENMPPRLMSSASNIGKTIAGSPQLGSTALLSGITVAKAIQKVSLNEPMPSGRIIVNVEHSFTEAIDTSNMHHLNSYGETL